MCERYINDSKIQMFEPTEIMESIGWLSEKTKSLENERCVSALMQATKPKTYTFNYFCSFKCALFVINLNQILLFILLNV